ncbi:hypothetical protein [Azospirillum picis]|uniref:K+ transporter n=1 Tax=Azospirillum picis TaxID=488438 RepID=A0ABU0MSM3_9PROT|nr:hypothetical protein [Azospirillum picis]MBP2302737.1 K+ transporter [Azospirillum picis]MDQ0536488.1 K+ transporter [Azospirillum picis]
MGFRFIKDHLERFSSLARVLGAPISASSDYAWRRRPESHRAAANRHLLPCWQEPTFVVLSKQSTSASDCISIPPDRAAELGMRLEI